MDLKYLKCWFETPSWEGSCAKQGAGELSRSPVSWCCSQKFTLSFSCCAVLSSARNVKCSPFCKSGTKITVTVVFKDFKSLDHPVFIVIYLQRGLGRAGIGYFSSGLKNVLWSTLEMTWKIIMGKQLDNIMDAVTEWRTWLKLQDCHEWLPQIYHWCQCEPCVKRHEEQF